MRGTRVFPLCIALLACACAAPAGAPLTTVRVASGLTMPLYVTAPPGDFNRLFIVEQRSGSVGRIKILNLNTGVINATPFIEISPVSTQSEQGLLGLAFHPDYAQNGYFYVNFTNSSGTTIIRRYTVSASDPDVADPGTGLQILSIAQPYVNHNGGWMAFGPDGYLYVATGDGGSFCDPGQRAQDITSQLLGKILRLDVDRDDFPADAGRNYGIPPTNPFVGVTGDDEIWAYGLRNPWRNAFDRATGDLYIADVGQDGWEEVNFQAASVTTAINYGWDCMEGTHCSSDAPSNCSPSGCTCGAAGLTRPIQEYQNVNNFCSITGGYVYRGCNIPDLQGVYFYADYCANQIFSFRYNGVSVTELTNRTAELDPPSFTINNITSFGEDARGELYICDQGGEIFKIVPATAPTPDCNQNGQSDSCDISLGASADCNNNQIPDECENPPPAPPAITAQPQSVTACAGRSASFSVVASGPGLTYQWRFNGGDIAGANAATLTINPVEPDDAGSYDVVVSNACGSVTSAAATLTLGLVGDSNCDGLVNNFDIDAFVTAISDGQAAWEGLYDCDYLCANDTNGDGNVNNFDIDAFVALLSP